jgi:hypothetical protein
MAFSQRNWAVIQRRLNHVTGRYILYEVEESPEQHTGVTTDLDPFALSADSKAFCRVAVSVVQ